MANKDRGKEKKKMKKNVKLLLNKLNKLNVTLLNKKKNIGKELKK